MSKQQFTYPVRDDGEIDPEFLRQFPSAPVARRFSRDMTAVQRVRFDCACIVAVLLGSIQLGVLLWILDGGLQ